MSKIFTFILCFFFFTGLLAQETVGIQFFHGTWAELLEKAEKEKKLIFVDAFAEWCGPCKAMAASAFPNKEVGEFFSEKFVSYKFDMEKGEGPTFAANYGVQYYPTVFILDAKGKVIEKKVGAMVQPQVFLDWAKKVVNPNDNPAMLKAQYEGGTEDAELLYLYLMREVAAGKEYDEPLNKYFATQKPEELSSERNWKTINSLVSDIQSKEFQYLLKNKKSFVAKYGQEPVDKKIAEVCKMAVKSNDKEDAALAISIAKKQIKDKGKTVGLLEILQLESAGDWKNYTAKVSTYLTKFKENDPAFLNATAWNFSQKVEDNALLQKALNWSKQAVAIDNSAINNLTLATLFSKLGNKEEALKTANKALKLAEDKNEDASAIKKFIDSLK